MQSSSRDFSPTCHFFLYRMSDCVPDVVSESLVIAKVGKDSIKIAIMKIPIMTHILEPYPLPLVKLIW